MAGILGFGREAVRIKVQKYDGSQPPDYRKFSVDPQLTSFEVLQSILSKAFDLKCDFSISYSMQDVQGNEVYMPLLSDWELDAAFLKAHNLSLGCNAEPCLSLRVDLKPFEECSDDWEVRNNVPVITQLRTGTAQEAKPSPRFHGIINQMGKTLNMVQRALNFGDDGSTSLQPPRPPLSDSEFRRFLDPVGQIMHTKELKSVIYLGGIDPSLRKVVWKHLLSVYPDGMTGKERMDYIKKLANEYINLRDVWKKALASGNVNGELGYTTGMVRKDVLRTDRHHPFFAGNDDNQNVSSLFNILTTYALNHPKVSYCQGMSDLASPLLVTMGDEAHAYICFCALMTRLCSNFMLDGIAMTQKFTHLAEGIMYYDPDFYNYLKINQADDLLFCYRWLLLEMKREFAFEDSLRMLEVLWSSLPANPPAKELKLFDVKFQQPLNTAKTPPISPLLKTPRENAYTKICALRRQSSSISLTSYPTKSLPIPRQNHSLDESMGRMNKSSSICFPTKYLSLEDTTLIVEESVQNKEPFKELIKDDDVSPAAIAINEDSETDVVKCVYVTNGVLAQKPKIKNLSASMSNISGLGSKRSGHFKNLKEKIVTSKMAIYSSLDGLDKEKAVSKHQQRIVRNLNEFLYFSSSNKSKNLENSRTLERCFEKKELSKSAERVLKVRRYHSTSSALTSANDTSEDNSPEDLKINYIINEPQLPVTNLRSANSESKDEISNGEQKTNLIIQITKSTEELEKCLDEAELLRENNRNVEKDGDTVFNKNQDNQRLNEESSIEDVHAQNIPPNKISSLHETVETQSEPFRTKSHRKNDEIFIWENPLPERSPSSVFKNIKDNLDCEKPVEREAQRTDEGGGGNIVVVENKLLNIDFKTAEDLTNSCEEITEVNNKKPHGLLPKPEEFGGGNPFLMFLCLTVLMQHRDHIISKNMDYNEMAMHFDKMVRKHDVNKVLNQARQMYAGYLKQHTMAQAQYKSQGGGGDC